MIPEKEFEFLFEIIQIRGICEQVYGMYNPEPKRGKNVPKPCNSRQEGKGKQMKRFDRASKIRICSLDIPMPL